MRYRLRKFVAWFFTGKVGLFDKTNPKATLKSVLLRAIVTAGVGAIAFVVVVRQPSRAAWLIAFPIWVLLNAGIGALAGWQSGDEKILPDGDNEHHTAIDRFQEQLPDNE